MSLAYTVSGYTVGPEAARTPAAVVYRGTSNARGKEVILKRVQNDAYARHEIEMHRRVEATHPGGAVHVVRQLGIEVQALDCWLVLEAFSATVHELDHRAMTPLAVMSVAVDAAKGLVEMARAGVVDDDVKPENIAFKATSGWVAHIDLGCARLRRQRPVGYTDEYAAPEIRAGFPSDTSPCYAWGRSMEFLVCGTAELGLLSAWRIACPGLSVASPIS
jgi:serine/threonine protein kinase